MLKTTNNEVLSTQTTEDERNESVSADVSVAGNGSASGSGAGGRIGKSIKNLLTITNLAKKSKLTKFKKSRLPNAKINLKTDFLTFGAKKTFIYLCKAFTEALILRHFDLKRHIWIETDVLGYVIGRVLNQMTLDYLDYLDQFFSNYITYKNLDLIFSQSKISQWHPIAFFSWKKIPAETWYKTYNQELLAIVKVFKTWRHYLEGCKYKVLVFTNYNNLYWFMSTKNLSSRQVCWA